MEIQHFSHQHPLTLCMVNASDFNDMWCFGCGKNNFDLMYICRTCENFCLHKTCAELPTKIERHPFHPSHALYIVFNGPSYACCGCGKKHEKLLYYCQGCNFTLNPECALNPTTKYDIVGEGRIKHVTHNHPLTFSDIIGVEQGKKCLACDKQCSSNETFYSCNICGAFSLHTSCMESLPRAITHPSHPEHPMMLRAKDQWFDRPCVKCGRTDNVLTYRCSMCKVEMDPLCALKQTKSKPESQNNPNKTQTLRSNPSTEIVKSFFGRKK